MGDLIKIRGIDDEPRIDSRDIAEELGVEHKNTLEMIRKFEVKLSKYGRVAFKTIPFDTPGGVQKLAICFLNEQQSTFLVTLSRNSEKAVELKQKLTDSYHFYKSQNSQISLPKTFAESLRLLADQVEKNQLLENKIESDKPLVEFAANIQESNDAISVSEFAKILCKNGYDTGEKRLFQKLRDMNLIFKRKVNEPYQIYIKMGLFKFDEFAKEVTRKSDGQKVKKLCRKITITGKGQVYIEKRLRKLQDL